jgi:hypothetical protein
MDQIAWERDALRNVIERLLQLYQQDVRTTKQEEEIQTLQQEISCLELSHQESIMSTQLIDWFLSYDDGRRYRSDDGPWNEAPWGPVKELVRVKSASEHIKVANAPFYFYTSYVDFPVHTWCPHACIRRTGRVKFGTWMTDERLNLGFRLLRKFRGIKVVEELDVSSSAFATLVVGTKRIDSLVKGRWAIVYDDLSIRTEGEGVWTEAPLDRVLAMVTKTGTTLQTNAYFYGTDAEGPLGSTDDITHAIQQVVPEMKVGMIQPYAKIAVKP